MFREYCTEDINNIIFGTCKPLIKFKLAGILDINRKYLIVGVMHPLPYSRLLYLA